MLTQWYDNGDAVMICSTNGLRVDDPQAQLVVMRLLLSESGHYILPVNKENQQMSDNDVRRITTLWSHNYDQATALEQTDKNDMNKTDKNVELQFQCQTTETDDQEVKDIDTKKEKTSNPQDNYKQVADDEEPIQVMMNDNYMQEYVEVEQEYTAKCFSWPWKASILAEDVQGCP